MLVPVVGSPTVAQLVAGESAERVPLAFFLVAAVIGVAGAILTNVVAAGIDRRIGGALDRAFLGGGPLVRLSGRVVALIILSVAREPGAKLDAKELKRIARGVPKAWETIFEFCSDDTQ